MQEYVNGFCLQLERQEVVMIRKNRPTFQAGKWNGVGGKIEVGEQPLQAMVREFFEETGVLTASYQWQHTVTLTGSDFRVHYFRCCVPREAWDPTSFKTMTDEEVCIFTTKHFRDIPMIENTEWVIRMQFSKGLVFPIYLQWLRDDEAKYPVSTVIN